MPNIGCLCMLSVCLSHVLYIFFCNLLVRLVCFNTALCVTSDQQGIYERLNLSEKIKILLWFMALLYVSGWWVDVGGFTALLFFLMPVLCFLNLGQRFWSLFGCGQVLRFDRWNRVAMIETFSHFFPQPRQVKMLHSIHSNSRRIQHLNSKLNDGVCNSTSTHWFFLFLLQNRSFSDGQRFLVS